MKPYYSLIIPFVTSIEFKFINYIKVLPNGFGESDDLPVLGSGPTLAPGNAIGQPGGFVVPSESPENDVGLPNESDYQDPADAGNHWAPTESIPKEELLKRQSRRLMARTKPDIGSGPIPGPLAPGKRKKGDKTWFDCNFRGKNYKQIMFYSSIFKMLFI